MSEKIYHILVTIGFIMLFIGMTLQLEQVIEDNENKEEIIDNQAKEIIKLKEENEHLWNNYYENVSDYKGEYEYYE